VEDAAEMSRARPVRQTIRNAIQQVAIDVVGKFWPEVLEDPLPNILWYFVRLGFPLLWFGHASLRPHRCATGHIGAMTSDGPGYVRASPRPTDLASDNDDKAPGRTPQLSRRAREGTGTRWGCPGRRQFPGSASIMTGPPCTPSPPASRVAHGATVRRLRCRPTVARRAQIGAVVATGVRFRYSCQSPEPSGRSPPAYSPATPR